MVRVGSFVKVSPHRPSSIPRYLFSIGCRVIKSILGSGRMIPAVIWDIKDGFCQITKTQTEHLHSQKTYTISISIRVFDSFSFWYRGVIVLPHKTALRVNTNSTDSSLIGGFQKRPKKNILHTCNIWHGHSGAR